MDRIAFQARSASSPSFSISVVFIRYTHSQAMGTTDGKDATPRPMTRWEESATIVALMRLRRFGESDKLASYLVGDANFENADLRGAYLHGASLTSLLMIYADLSGADLSQSHLSRAILVSANLSNANLTDADLSKSELLDANFQNADLTGADLREADLEGVNFSGANLKGARIDAASINKHQFSEKQRRELMAVDAALGPAALLVSGRPGSR